MIASAIAVLLLTSQPAEAEVAAEAEVQTEARAEAPAEAAPEAPDPQDEVICRRRMIPAERIGQRFNVQRDCRTRAEWEEERRRTSRR